MLVGVTMKMGIFKVVSQLMFKFMVMVMVMVTITITITDTPMVTITDTPMVFTPTNSPTPTTDHYELYPQSSL